MGTLPLLLGLICGSDPDALPTPPEPARLRELLYDRQRPRLQNQAALLLVQNRTAEAEQLVRAGLRQTDSPEVFMALTAALRLTRDQRFLDELLQTLTEGKPAIRPDAAEALAVLADETTFTKLQSLASQASTDLPGRQAAIWALGRSGRQEAVAVLISLVAAEDLAIRRAAGDALAELSGQTFGTEVKLWHAWWVSHRQVAPADWLQERLAYQISRARRLEGELERSRGHVLRLQQQLYSRLPAADRLAHVQTLVDHDDAPVRALAVAWCAELLPAADAVGQRTLADVLLRLARDGALEVQRPAVLALGRVGDARAFEHIRLVLERGPVPVRAAAAHALAQQALTATSETRPMQQEVVPLLQKALDDPSLEVVSAAAEGLGSLGVSEAGPVLTALLKHPCEPVRQTAAQALERVADPGVLDGLLALVDDRAVTVRFSLVGAIGRAAGDGQALTEAQRARLYPRLEELVLRDLDAGVRSRATTVLGQCGGPAQLPFLLRRALAAEDTRVQEKAWEALEEVLGRAASLELVRDYDRQLTEARQGARRLQLLTGLGVRWKKNDATRALVIPVTEALVQAQLQEGKWTAAFPLVRELLSRPGTDAELDRRLRWFQAVGELALLEGNREEARRVVQEAQPFLARWPGLAPEFEKLNKRAQ